MTRWLFPVLLFAAATAPLEITVDPQPGAFFIVVLEGRGAGAGEFRGSVSLNDSSLQVPLSGAAETSEGRVRVRTTLRYSDVPADWLTRFRPDSFDYRIQGEVPGAAAISWSGALRWKEVAVAGKTEALSRFLKLASFELTALSEKRTEGRAVLAAVNPFAFPISAAAASYRIRVNGGDIGGGTARGRVVRAKRKAGLDLPFTVDRGRFLAAAGERWAVGADVNAELAGSLTLRFPTAEVSVPFRFSGRMGTDGARSGVFSYPDGATSLSPRR